MRQQGKLFNSEGEIIAEGTCELSESTAGDQQVTMWTAFEQVLMERQQGPMTLMLEDGTELAIAEERRLKFRVNGSGDSPSFIYKLRVVNEQRLAPEAHPPLAQESLPAKGKGSPTRP